jgi:hypothetical protein
LGLVVGFALALAIACGGESAREQRRVPSGSGGRGQAGKGGASGSGGVCTACSGVGGRAGGGGSSGSAGSGTGAGTSGGRTSQGGASNGGASSGARGGSDGGGEAGEPSLGGRAAGGRAQAGTAGDLSVGMAGAAAATDGLTLTKVAAYQGVEVTLFEDGTAPLPNAPIVSDRSLTLRAFVTPGPDWAARTVSGELTIKKGSTSRSVLSTLAANGPSAPDSFGTTLNFELSVSDVTVTTLLSLVIRDSSGDGAELARWPAAGEQALGAQSSNGPFGIVLVPLVSGGYAPVADSALVSRFSRYMNELYPASSVELSVHDPVTLTYEVDSSGYGWDEALDELLATRDADDPEPRIYYYGLLTPGATMDDYCPVDCVVGLSNVAGRNQESYRGSIGTAYFETPSDTFSQETMGHELGHALGRDHAPCGGPDYPDRNYPYAGASLGVYGFDGQKLLDPFDNKDVMGYCVPVWISDYTWKGIFDRITYVNRPPKKVTPSPRAERPRQRTLIVGQDGRLRWGSEKAPSVPPDGEPVVLELLDASGAVLDELVVPFAAFDHLDGGFLSVPVDLLQRSGATSVRVGAELVGLP